MNPSRHNLLTLITVAAALLLAVPAAAQSWLPTDLALDESGMPVEMGLGDASLALGAMVPLISDDLMAGDRHAVTGLCAMTLALSFQPSLQHLLADNWQGGLSRSLGRLGALATGALGFYMMAYGPKDDRDGWGVLFNLSGAAMGALMIWDVLDPPVSPVTDKVPLAGFQLGVTPLIMAPAPRAGEGAPPVLGLRLSLRF